MPQPYGDAMSSSFDTVVLDVDGTLVDSNYQHAMSWFKAFRRFDVTPSLWRIHRALGMGGDKLVTEVAGDEVEQRHGDGLRTAWEEELGAYLPEICAVHGARRLLERLHERGCVVVIASSGKSDHVDHYLDLLDARPLADAWTSSADAEQTKPAPDLLTTALDRVDHGNPVMVGDSIWDVISASEIDLNTHCLLTGGFSVAELEKAGAAGVHEDLDALWTTLNPLLMARRH